MSNKFDEDKSELYCSTVAKSISNIIRFSLDEEFRLESFKILQTQSTKETEVKIYENLKQVIEKRKCGVLTAEGGIQNENTEKYDKDFEVSSISTSQETSTPSTSTQDSDSQSSFSSENFHKRNWLKILSEKYKQNFKKRKIQFFSQSNTFSTETYKNFVQTPDFTTSTWDHSFNTSFSQNSFKNSQEYEDDI